ncbi:MAG TPA: hypothetical protein VLG67_01845 [Candidatus Saccharimonadales bacterium]|nr:hypothetical protein [Candidatus Saccharimonadales bacterium]
MPINSQIIPQDHNAQPLILPSQSSVNINSFEETSTKLNMLRTKVLERRPALSDILHRLGPMTMYQIAESYAKDSNTAMIELERKNEFIQTFSSEVAKILGQGVAQSTARQLSEHYYVSTAEHHSPLTTPDYFNSSVHHALYASDAKNSKLENIIVLACANVSFDNYASPRGLVFNSFSGTKPGLTQIPLFSRSVRSCPVVYYPSYGKQAIQDAKLKIDSLLREGSITPKNAEGLYFILDSVYSRNDVLNLSNYSDQITKTNYILWNKLFFFLGDYTPNLVYIEQERVVNKLLLEHHIYQNTIIHNILFNTDYHTLMEKHFDKIEGAFTLDERTGTYLFWALPPGQKYRVRLWKEGNKLVSEDRSYEVELTPDSLAKAITNKELIPSTMLDYILLAFYYGLKLHGGVNQPTVLSKTKIAFLRMLNELGDRMSIQECIGVPTTALSMHRPSLAFLKSPKNTLTPASSIDILLYGNKNSWNVMKQNSKNITYGEILYRTLPNLYKFVYETDEQDKQLMNVSESEIDAITGLDKKIIPLAEV